MAEDFTRIAPPYVGPSSWKAHSIRIYLPGLSNIGKIYLLVFAFLISRLLNSHPHIYLGLMGLSPRCRLSGLVGKNFPPCLCVPYSKAFGFSPSYLGPMGLSPSCRLLGLVGKNACVFCFLCCGLYPNRSTLCRPLF